jgi:glutathione S-transferase
MLKIYGVYRSRASRNIWLANELGLPFEHVPVIQHYRVPATGAASGQTTTQSPSFLKVNPSGQIPSIDDDGVILHQSLAINLYLAKKHGGPLAPATVAEDGLMTMWSLWAATDVEPHSLNVLYHTIGKPPAERDPAIAAAGVAALRKPFAVLDHQLSTTGYVVGSRFTVADVNVAEIVRYAMPAQDLFKAAPHVQTWLQACHARPHFKAMMSVRDQEPV